MKNRIRLSAALLSIVAIAACFGVYSKDRVEAATRPQEPGEICRGFQQPAVNAAPNQPRLSPRALYGPSFAFLAWNLFLQAMAPGQRFLDLRDLDGAMSTESRYGWMPQRGEYGGRRESRGQWQGAHIARKRDGPV